MNYHGLYESNYTNLLFLSFLLVGFVSGIYHGIYNKQIYHPKVNDNLNIHEKIHTFWIHLVCGLVGGASLYTLIYKYLLSRHVSMSFSGGDAGLMLIGLLGLVGLGPMTLWFLVQAIIYSKDALGRFIGLPKEPTQE